MAHSPADIDDILVKLATLQTDFEHTWEDIRLMARHMASIEQSLSGLKMLSDMVAQNPLFSRFLSPTAS